MGFQQPFVGSIIIFRSGYGKNIKKLKILSVDLAITLNMLL